MFELKPLSPARYQHCLSVARFAWSLAHRWGAPPMAAYLAGLLHDMARELPPTDLLRHARAHGLPVTSLEERHPVLLHGAVAAVLAKEKYGIAEAAVLAAMAKHTVGDAVMSPLDQVVFLADKIEPLRDYGAAPNLRALAFTDLGQALLLAIEEEIAYHQARNYEIDRRTLAMREILADGDAPVNPQ